MGQAKETQEKEITLVMPAPQDHKHIVDLRNENARWFFSPGHVTLASHHIWYKHVMGDSSQIFYAVKLGLEIIGTVGLSNILYYHRCAEYGQFLIAEGYRGNGYGRAALASLLRKAFDEFGLRRVYGEVYADNAAGLAVVSSLGFQVEGKLREHTRRGGDFVDVVRVGILREEFHG